VRRLPRRTWRRIRLFLGLLGAAILLCLMPSRFTAPARIVFNEAAGPVETAAFQGTGEVLVRTGTLVEAFGGPDRERALARDVTTLRNSLAALADALARARAAMDSVEALDVKEMRIRRLRAPVASYDTSAARRSITVRAGTRDGVGPGVAVTADGGLVGVVVEAGPGQSRVRLITDPGSALPCRPSARQGLCVLQGTGGRVCSADWVDRVNFLERGDVLVTVSLDVLPESRLHIPDGIPAATVVRVSTNEMKPLFAAVEAAPRVNLDRLEAVEILIPVEDATAGGPAPGRGAMQ
jgi:rod shape-determining protein MreC